MSPLPRFSPAALSLENGPHLFTGTMPYVADSRYSPEDIYKVVSLNLKQGVRHIDTAEIYTKSFSHIRKAIRDSKIPRSHLFVCSKLKGLPSDDYAMIKRRVESHLKALEMKYVDVLLIHWPGPKEADLNADPDVVSQTVTWSEFDAKIDKAWENMIQLQQDGFTKKIGVSNFYNQHIHRLLSSKVIADIEGAASAAAHEGEPEGVEGTEGTAPGDGVLPLVGGTVSADLLQNCRPYVNQIYLDATQHQYQFVQELQERGIHVMAYRPLQFLPALKTAGSLGDTVFQTIEDLRLKRGEGNSKNEYKSTEEFILSWLFARGINVCVKSSNGNHIRENIAAKTKVAKFPETIIDKFPEPTELSVMLLAYDAYAEVFQTT